MTNSQKRKSTTWMKRSCRKKSGIPQPAERIREGILLFSIMEKEVWNKASEIPWTAPFYEQNKAKYVAGDRVEARLFSTSDKTFLEPLNPG